MPFFRYLITLYCLLLPTLLPAAGGGYQGGGALPSSMSLMSPEEHAIAAYNSGLKKRDRAWAHEQKAESLENKRKKQKSLDKAYKHYKAAIKKFRQAIEHKPDMYQAHSSLGYALRKTGALDEALQAYQMSLSINPDYAEAIEYQAETHMRLYQYDAVRTAYARLLVLNPEYAEKLLSAAEQWLGEQNKNDDAGLAEFLLWVASARE